MPVRSHVDLCLFVRFIHISKEQVTPEVVEELREASTSQSKFDAWRKQYASNARLMFHEAYHYWQGLRLPFLHWYALANFRNIFLIFRALSKANSDITTWDAFVPDFHLISHRWQLWHRGAASFLVGLSGEQAPQTIENHAALSIIDLLENATSLVEWQVDSAARHGDLRALVVPSEYRKWWRRNPAYVTAYKFVVNVLGDEELAIRCFVPLICAAFHTSDPIKGFVNLLRILMINKNESNFRAFCAQREPCRWRELFEMMLDKIHFEAEDDLELGFAIKQPFFRLHLSTWVNASWNQEGLAHPFLTPLAKEFMRRVESHPGLASLLTHLPWIAPEESGEFFRDFQPPITVTRIETHDGGNHVITVGDPGNIHWLPTDGLAEVLAIYSTVRRATETHFDPDHRLCHHVACPLFGPNYCNSYPLIPKRYEECNFPYRIEEIRKAVSRM